MYKNTVWYEEDRNEAMLMPDNALLPFCRYVEPEIKLLATYIANSASRIAAGVMVLTSINVT